MTTYSDWKNNITVCHVVPHRSVDNYKYKTQATTGFTLESASKHEVDDLNMHVTHYVKYPFFKDYARVKLRSEVP